jgi:hypothetical protein
MTDDRLNLIRDLLWGRRINYVQTYLKADSPDEKSARTALAELLRGEEPIPREIRHDLADLFDPTWRANERRILFKKRGGRGASPNVYKNKMVALDIYTAVRRGDTLASAKTDAADKFGLGDSRVRDIWKEYGPYWARRLGALSLRRGRPEK